MLALHYKTIKKALIPPISAGKEFKRIPMSTNTYNTITITKSQDKLETPKFYESLQKLHNKNKKALGQVAISNEEHEKAQRIMNCTDFLTYELINQEFLRLKRINLCRERLCLNCQLVNSRNLIKQLFWTVPRLKVPQESSLEFVTLTTQNCEAKYLKDTIQRLSQRQVAFFRHYKIKDYFRSVEITYNEKTQKYHPHLHIIAIINKNSGFPFYEPHKGKEGANKLQSAWYQWYGVPNEHGYNMATSYPVRNTKSIFELCKYISKVENLEKKEVLTVLDKQLKGLRLKTPAGQFKTLAKGYKNECATLKLQELKELEEAEICLINLLYNKKTKEYEIKSISEADLHYRPSKFWHERRIAEEGVLKC